MKVTKFIVVAIVYLASVAVAPSVASSTAAPAPSPAAFDYVERCAKELTEKCGNEVFSGVFLNTTVEPICCKQLVAVGKTCHDVMIKAYISFPLVMPNPGQEADVLEKSEDVWNQCVAVGYVVGKAVVSFAQGSSSV